jgi:2-polyprenyl-3-methyl-5-hydroxy-6-metoxy-1,4-benzoquinol methylase
MKQITSCAICGKEGIISFDLKTYAVLYCGACDLRWKRELFDEELIDNKDYYWGKKFFMENEEYLRQLWKKEIKTVEGLLAESSKQRWLDIGCSFGYLISEAKKRGFSVTGVEAVRQVVDLAREREDLEIVHSLINGINRLPHEHYDVISLFDVLEHLQYPNEALGKLSSFAEKGSLLVLEVPEENSLFRKIGYLLFRLSGGRFTRLVKAAFNEHVAGHRLGFSVKALKAFLAKYGWTVIRTEKTMMPFRFFIKEFRNSKNALSHFIDISASIFFYFLSIGLGMQNRVKVYAKKN